MSDIRAFNEEVVPHVVPPKDLSNLQEGPSLRHLDTVIALYDFPKSSASHLPLRVGDAIYVLSRSETGWLDGIIKNTSGKVLRGWFPQNYVRSVNYAQPAVAKMKNDKELESITAANTAANFLLSSFIDPLQKTEEKPTVNSRKNSVVSFASSETSNHSESKLSQSSYPSHSSSLRSQSGFSPHMDNSRHEGTIDGLVNSYADNENNFNFSKTFDELEVPHEVPEENFEENSGIQSNSNKIVLTPLDIAEGFAEEYREKTGKTPSWISRCATDGSLIFYCDQLKIYCDTLPMISYPSGTAPSTLEIAPKDVLVDGSVVDVFCPRAEKSFDQRMDSSASLDPLKRDSYATASTQSENYTFYHHFVQPFFNMDGLFYSSPGDVKKWTDLRDELFYLLDLTKISLKEYDRQLFGTHITKLTSLVNCVFLAVRLSDNDYKGTKYEGSVKKRVKKIISSFSQLYTNGFLHLSIMVTPNDIQMGPENTRSIIPTKLSDIIVNKSTSVDSASTIKVTDGNELDSLRSGLEKVRLNFGLGENNHYYELIEIEMNSLKKSVRSLTNTFLKITNGKKVKQSDYFPNDNSDTSDNDSGDDRFNILPELHPRLLKGEFNGGNWCNYFLPLTNRVLNASGDDLKNKTHSKVIINFETYNRIEALSGDLVTTSKEVLSYLDPNKQHLYYNDELKAERNNQILRLVYRFMFQAGSMVDLIESFDFTVFSFVKKYSLSANSSRDWTSRRPLANIDAGLLCSYPFIMEFFQIKQNFHDLISKTLMATQSLTLDDPDVFKGIEDDKAVFYDRNLAKDFSEKEAMLLKNVLLKSFDEAGRGSLYLNPDDRLAELLHHEIAFHEKILSSVQQLVEERETILNYATRIMVGDMNVQLLLMERNNTIQSDKSDENNGAVYGGRGKSDVPWYLEADEEYDLLLDIKGLIKGGTKEALVAHLTHHDAYDSNFISAFLFSFSTMMSLGELVENLIRRFSIEPPEGLSFEEYNIWISKKQNPIRLRVLNLMKLILEKHWSDSYYDENVIKRWLEFAHRPQPQSYSIGKIIVHDLVRIQKGERICAERKPSIPHSKPPAPLIKSFMKKRMKLLDIEYIELARQLTIREFNLYSKISELACLNKVWGKKSGVQESIVDISNFIRESNLLTNFVSYMILRKSDIKKRVQMIRYFVQVAEKCRQYNNFSSMTAIISALYSSPIHRLKKTWQILHSDTHARLQSMNKLMNSSRNFNEYRDVLKFVGSEPCVPFFGVFLSDLTFVFHGNPDYIQNRVKMINFAKRAKTYEIVEGLDRFKVTAYNLQNVPEIQKYLDTWLDKCPTIAEQYQISLEVEPKEDAGSNSTPATNVFNSAWSRSSKPPSNS